MPDFFQTGMGRKFYESDVPRIASALESIVVNLEKVANPMQEVAEVKKPEPIHATEEELESLRLMCEWWYKSASPQDSGGDQSVSDTGYALLERLKNRA